MNFSTKWNFETVGKSQKPFIRSFEIFILTKVFKKLLYSSVKLLVIVFPSSHAFLESSYNACFINGNLELQPLPFDLLPCFWFTRLFSCLIQFLICFLSTLNFLEAEEKFLPFSQVHRVTDNLNHACISFSQPFLFWINVMPLWEKIQETKCLKWEC